MEWIREKVKLKIAKFFLKKQFQVVTSICYFNLKFKNLFNEYSKNKTIICRYTLDIRVSFLNQDIVGNIINM